MSYRFLRRAAPKLGLVLFAVAVATPALANDAYNDNHPRGGHGAYDRYVRDANDHHRHHVTDRRNSLGHAIGDLFRYGTTNPYSSARHYYTDQHRAYDHLLRDEHRNRDHHLRDRHNDHDYYNGHGYSPHDPY